MAPTKRDRVLAGSSFIATSYPFRMYPTFPRFQLRSDLAEVSFAVERYSPRRGCGEKTPPLSQRAASTCAVVVVFVFDGWTTPLHAASLMLALCGLSTPLEIKF
jgi:hypothetical protein